ncbi:hypothetical protein A6A08_10790 [Nocardiopsis sp. TSRI0078]|uniref:hypothetical protein n=1 Tax=unclassified Nocardiopsis TaxID=2649073 RepID=UPI0009397E6B|nr:hypothetical protein [Nocardiopsis sp. TSRI0078]OKI15016.1 hypothetical protein A6A08_10790 [Nocardiopsis sp. TSRI0078]
MFSSGQDPYDPDGTRDGDGVPPRGMPDFGAHFDALRPDAPLPRKVALVRVLMFVGGACGLALSALFLMGLSVPSETMAEAMRQQADAASGQSAEFFADVGAVRAMMVAMAAITGVYGALSTLLAARIRHRTVGVFWGVVLFQSAAGALLLWNLYAGDLLAVVPLGFAATMVAHMFSREARAHYGLL